MPETDEIDQIREQLARLEARIDALSRALQAGIIDAPRLRRKGIIGMLDGLRLEHCLPGARAALPGSTNSPDPISQPDG